MNSFQFFLSFFLAFVASSKDTIVPQDNLDNLIAPWRFVLHIKLPFTVLDITRLDPESVIAQQLLWHESRLEKGKFMMNFLIITSGIQDTYYDTHDNDKHLPYMATASLAILWLVLRPLYIAVVRNTTPLERHEWLHITIGELSLRLYFAWLTCAVYFGVVDISQHLFGHHFNFDVYVVILTTFLALACTAFIFVRDPVVVFIMAWVVVGLADRKVTFESDAQETFDKLQTVGNTIKPVLLLVLLIYAIRL
ncbi:hypothetical protein PHYBOEH_002958 [Phytophthora boehmeriae]|uniref:Uncharacterized protein n=1 Tax=Phytophthora boehmeriae TaxID=109152 RepID=A0A8T1V2U8_9STRA|nr:hypothetical protein PHYBOEH_002958 [Phytophthora boehmeriae]